MTTDNDRTGLILARLQSLGWRTAFEPDRGQTILTVTRLRAGIKGGCESHEYVEADPATCVESAAKELC